MDAKAHLLSLGWAGPGHALDSRSKQKGRRGLAYQPTQAHSPGHGLVRPLLISQRKDRFGIGRKAHEPFAGNEWWLKGFEAALGNIGKSESERTSDTATLTADKLGHNAKHEGLYGFFVKGQAMEGTIGEDMLRREAKRTIDQTEESSSKEVGSEHANTGTRRLKKDAIEDFTQVGAFLVRRDKDEKRWRREQKLNAFDEFKHAGEFFDARSGRTKMKRKSEVEDEAPKEEDSGIFLGETKAERQGRRRRSKEEKVARKAKLDHKRNVLPAPVEGKFIPQESHGDQERKAQRKMQRKRVKEGEK